MEQQKHSFAVNLNIDLKELPSCTKCSNGTLLPVCDDSRDGAYYLKGWVCSSCDRTVYTKAGTIYSGMAINGDVQGR